tara:strand:- start:1071 stop:1259 length:189 start_codon:yes stop_codon:yes gene_type:complete
VNSREEEEMADPRNKLRQALELLHERQPDSKYTVRIRKPKELTYDEVYKVYDLVRDVIDGRW